MTTVHVLDRPVWSALSTRQQGVSVGGARARRFASDIGPLAGARDDEPESLAALGELAPENETLVLLQADPIVLPPSVRATTIAEGVQLVLAEHVETPRDPRIVPLGPDVLIEGYVHGPH